MSTSTFSHDLLRKLAKKFVGRLNTHHSGTPGQGPKSSPDSLATIILHHLNKFEEFQDKIFCSHYRNDFVTKFFDHSVKCGGKYGKSCPLKYSFDSREYQWSSSNLQFEHKFPHRLLRNYLVGTILQGIIDDKYLNIQRFVTHQLGFTKQSIIRKEQKMEKDLVVLSDPVIPICGAKCSSHKIFCIVQEFFC